MWRQMVLLLHLCSRGESPTVEHRASTTEKHAGASAAGAHNPKAGTVTGVHGKRDPELIWPVKGSYDFGLTPHIERVYIYIYIYMNCHIQIHI